MMVQATSIINNGFLSHKNQFACVNLEDKIYWLQFSPFNLTEAMFSSRGRQCSHQLSAIFAFKLATQAHGEMGETTELALVGPFPILRLHLANEGLLILGPLIIWAWLVWSILVLAFSFPNGLGIQYTMGSCLCSAVQYSTVQCSVMVCSAFQCSKVL